jgi:hypothetical protein
VLARCPSCRQTFPTDKPGQQECPHCKRPLVVPEFPVAPKPIEPPPQATFEPSPLEAPEAEGTPWERRAQLGLWPAWKQTVLWALFEPSKVFSSARLDRGKDQLWFAVLTGSVFWATGQLLDRVLFSGQREQAMKMIAQLREQGTPLPPIVQKLLSGTVNDNSMLTTVLLSLLAPVIVFLLVYANAGVTHASAMVLGQAKRGFPATFAAATYGLAPMVLLVIPGCGGLIAPIWCAVLIGVGLKLTHRITPGGAAATVAAPYVFLCCGGCAIAVAVGALFGRSMSGMAP